MAPTKRNLVTGLVVLGALLTLVWMVLTFSGRAMRLLKPKGEIISFISDRADGLSDGSPVFYKGVEVGRATGVTLLDDNVHIRISAEVQNNPPLPANLTGSIRNQSQLGTSCLIDLRANGEPTGKLAPGQEVQLRYLGNSLFPPEFTDMVEQFNKQQVMHHVDEMIVSMKKEAERIGKLVDTTQGLLGDKGIQGDFRTIIANVRETTEKANRLASSLDELTRNTNATMVDVRAATERTDKNLTVLTREAAENLDKLGQIFTEFHQIAEKVNHGKGAAGAFVNDPRLYDELSSTARELNSVAKTMSRLLDQWEKEGVSIKSFK